eukprot:g9775.t1
MRPGRIGGNRRCADCDAELTDYGNIWASVDQGCFVCVHCLAVHRSLGFRTKSVNMDFWGEDEVARMTSMGNVKVNEIYERYVPSSWTKPTPDADQHTREQWVLAKYKHRYFMLPHYGKEGVDVAGYQSPSSLSQTLPIRLVDYFVVVGTGGFLLDDRVNPNSLPEDIELREEVLDCFPEADSHHGYPLPEHLPQFVFPDGMRLHSHEKPPTTFPFVLTNSCGLKMHGAVLHVTEEIDSQHVGGMVSQALNSSSAAAAAAAAAAGNRGGDGGGGGHGEGGVGGQRGRTGAPLTPAQLPGWLRDTMATPERTGGDERGRERAGHQYPQLYAPKALVLLSHYPFYNLYTQFLQQIYRIGLSEAPLPIERYISNFVCEVPLPPQGQVEVNYALPDRTLTITRPPKNRLPLVDFSYRPLFASLSVENVLCAFGLLLTEAKVALCSSHYALLAPAAEGLLSLLFPFVWQGAYIPVMPFNMKDVLEAPVPFLVGVHSRYLQETSSDRRPEGVVFVDLDNDSIYLGLDEDMGAPRRRPHLPEREASKLRQKLNEFSPAARRARSPPAAYASSSSSAGGGPAAPGIGIGGVNSTISSSLEPSSSSVEYTRAGSAALAAAAAAAAGGVGGDTSGGGGGSGGRVGGVGGVDFSLSKVDLAFPNNEHLLPISSFSTEQGLTVPSLSSQSKSAGLMARVTSQRKPSKKKDKSSRNAGVAVRFGTQMFERFLEERTTNPTQPEVRFFDESIAAKLNRSKTHPIKRDTPFLNDLSDAHNQVFNPPAPSNWGLPDDGSQYAYGLSFPRLNKDRYGTVRWAKRLFKTPDQHRNVSSVNHQRLLSGARWRGGGGGGSSRRSTPKGSGSGSGTGLTVRREESHARLETEAVMKGIVRLQALYRMHQGKTSFKAQKEAAAAISRAWRNGQATAGDRLMLYTVVMLVKDIQRVYRGHLARTAAGVRLDSVCKLQAWQRMLLLRRRYRRMKSAAELVQAIARGRNCRVAFLVVRELVILAQAAVRGWIERRVAAKQRKARVDELRAQVFELWVRASTPLVYRSKFWMLFQGGAFLDLAVHEDEALRLWRDLGLVEHEKEHLARVHFNQTFTYVSEWLRTTRPASGVGPLLTNGKGAPLVSSPRSAAAAAAASVADQSVYGSSAPSAAAAAAAEAAAAAAAAAAASADDPNEDGGGLVTPTKRGPATPTGTHTATSSPASASLRSRVLRHNSVAGAMKKLGNGANLGLTSGVLATLGLSSLRRGSTAVPSPAKGGGGQPAAVARQAAERLSEERDRLYVELKEETQGGTRVSLFSLFGLEKQKKRKRKLVGGLWCDHALADASAQVVLSVFRDHMEARHAWVENKRDARVRADLLCTVQACILSVQRLRHPDHTVPAEAPHEKQRQAVRASAIASLTGSMGGADSVPAFSRPESWVAGAGGAEGEGAEGEISS